MKKQFRKLLLESNFFIASILIIGLAVTGYLILLKYEKQWDLTQNKKYSLSEQTKGILNDLDQKLEVFAFFKTGSYDGEAANTLLKQYSRFSDKIEYQFIDPDRNPLLANKLQINAYGTTVFKLNNKRKDVPINDLYVFGNTSSEDEFRGEEAYSSAILSLLASKSKTIYFTIGHAEKNLSSNEQDGLSFLKQQLEREVFKVKEISLLKSNNIPKNCDLLVIAGPKKPFFTAEIAQINKFLLAGGKVIIMSDPETANNLNKITLPWGIQVNNDIVIDESNTYYLDAATLIPQYIDHLITADLAHAKVATMLPVVNSLNRVTTNSEITITPLLISNKEAWAETNHASTIIEYTPNIDPLGPFNVAMLAEKTISANETQQLQSQIVVIGDSDFISNGYLNIQANIDLFINAANYLLNNKKRITLRPKINNDSALTISGSQSKLVSLFSFAYPLLIVIFGLLLWRHRKKL